MMLKATATSTVLLALLFAACPEDEPSRSATETLSDATKDMSVPETSTDEGSTPTDSPSLPDSDPDVPKDTAWVGTPGSGVRV